MGVRNELSNITRQTRSTFLSVHPAFEVAALELGPEAQHILLEVLLIAEFAGFEIALDVVAVELVDGEFAEVGPGLGDDLRAVVGVDGVESIGA